MIPMVMDLCLDILEKTAAMEDYNERYPELGQIRDIHRKRLWQTPLIAGVGSGVAAMGVNRLLSTQAPSLKQSLRLGGSTAAGGAALGLLLGAMKNTENTKIFKESVLGIPAGDREGMLRRDLRLRRLRELNKWKTSQE